MTSSPYSRRTVQRSLLHFGAGKMLGLTIGLGWMLLLVRMLPAHDYGLYMAFTGIGELSMLAFGLGLSLIAERYVPELKLAGRHVELRWLALGGFALRVTLLILGSFVVIACAPWILGDAPGVHIRPILSIFMVSIVAEAAGRWTETVFDSLLLQSHSQISMLLRYGSRVSVLACYALQQQHVDLHLWVITESICYALSAAFSFWLMNRVTSFQLRSTDHADLDYRRYLRFAWPSYVAEMVGLLSSLDTTRILVVRLFGAPAAALTGFCVSLCWMVQRYLPTFLLVGLLRPLFVSALQTANPTARLNLLFNLLVKLNLFVMVPAIAVGLLNGDFLISALSGHRFESGGTILWILLLLILCQAVRATLALMASVFEDGKGRLWATMLSSATFLLLAISIGRMALPILLSGLILGECLASALLAIRIRQHGTPLVVPYRALGSTGIGALMAAIAMHSTLLALPDHNLLSLLVSLLTAAVTYLVLTALFKPFESQEREIVNSMIPRKVFIW